MTEEEKQFVKEYFNKTGQTFKFVTDRIVLVDDEYMLVKKEYPTGRGDFDVYEVGMGSVVARKGLRNACRSC